MLNGYLEMTVIEIEAKVVAIIERSSSEQTVRDAIAQELGYPYGDMIGLCYRPRRPSRREIDILLFAPNGEIAHIIMFCPF